MNFTATALDFDIIFANQAYLVQIPPQFCMAEAEKLQLKCQKLCQADSEVKKIILDFSKTTFLDSSGLLGLCKFVNFIRDTNIELSFWSFSEEVQMIFAIAGLDGIFQAEDGTEAINLGKDVKDREDKIHPSVVSKTKRLIDICGALVGLGITAALFVPIAIAIKLDSPGPILFSQTRSGYMGKKFRIWKFRSMVANASDLKHQVANEIKGPFFKNECDPRITRVGRFLRKVSLDEFPQFWNVLKGDMSLVGTRPPTCEEVESYEVAYGQRLDVKPGLTGEWQVNGRSTVKDFQDVLRLDLQYQQKWSLIYDLKLILKTIGVIFSKKSGAC